MTTTPIAAPTYSTPGVEHLTIPSDDPKRFAVLRSPAIPEFGFLIRTDAEPRYGWEAWLTIRPTHAPEDLLSAIAERSDHAALRVRIASNAGELDGFLLAAAAPAIGVACGSADVTTLFVQHAARSTTYRDALAISNVRVVDLEDSPLAFLERHGIAVIAKALSWVDWEHSRGIPRPITSDRLRFLGCHIAHLERDLAPTAPRLVPERRFHR